MNQTTPMNQTYPALSVTGLRLIGPFSAFDPVAYIGYISKPDPCLVFKHRNGFAKLCMVAHYWESYDILRGWAEFVSGTDPTRPGRKTTEFNFECARDRMIAHKQINNFFQYIK